MHPMLARYLNFDVAVDTLHRDELGQVLKAEERPFAEAARRDEERRAALLAARGTANPAPEVQQALLALAAHAAVGALREDTGLAAALKAAEAALLAEGAGTDEVDTFLASLILEEAFGYEEGVDDFDEPFFEETLRSVPALASLSREKVNALVQRFVTEATLDWTQAHEKCASALIQTAWSEGPEPINPEHVEHALEQAARALGKSGAPKAPEAMRKLVGSLAREGLVGPIRRKHLEEKLVATEAELGLTPRRTLN